MSALYTLLSSFQAHSATFANEYAESALELIYRDCVNASEEESTDVRGVLPQPVGVSRQAPSPLQVPRAFASSANLVVKQQVVLASPFATTTGAMPPPRFTTSQQVQAFTELPSLHVSSSGGCCRCQSGPVAKPSRVLSPLPPTQSLSKGRRRRRRWCSSVSSLLFVHIPLNAPSSSPIPVQSVSALPERRGEKEACAEEASAIDCNLPGVRMRLVDKVHRPIGFGMSRDPRGMRLAFSRLFVSIFTH